MISHLPISAPSLHKKGDFVHVHVPIMMECCSNSECQVNNRVLISEELISRLAQVLTRPFTGYQWQQSFSVLIDWNTKRAVYEHAIRFLSLNCSERSSGHCRWLHRYEKTSSRQRWFRKTGWHWLDSSFLIVFYREPLSIIRSTRDEYVRILQNLGTRLAVDSASSLVLKASRFVARIQHPPTFPAHDVYELHHPLVALCIGCHEQRCNSSSEYVW